MEGPAGWGESGAIGGFPGQGFAEMRKIRTNCRSSLEGSSLVEFPVQRGKIDPELLGRPPLVSRAFVQNTKDMGAFEGLSGCLQVVVEGGLRRDEKAREIGQLDRSAAGQNERPLQDIRHLAE